MGLPVPHFVLCNAYYEKLDICFHSNKANLRDLIAATGLAFLLKNGLKSLIFGPMWPGNLMEKTIGHLLYTMSSFVHHFKAIGELKLELQSGKAQFGSKLVIFCPLWPQNLTDDLEKQYKSHLSATSSFVLHFIVIYQFKMKLQYRNTKLGKNLPFFVPCDLEIWRMTLKNNRAPLLCYFKLCASFHSHMWIHNGVIVLKRQIWVKIGDFLSRVTLKFVGWPWKVTGHLFYTMRSFVHHFKPTDEFKLQLHSISVKVTIFLSRVTLKFDRWPSKTKGQLFYAASSTVHHFIAIKEFTLELQSGNAKFWSKSTIFLAVWPWNLTDEVEKC